jgi:hypothetical protein
MSCPRRTMLHVFFGLKLVTLPTSERSLSWLNIGNAKGLTLGQSISFKAATKPGSV